MSAIAGFILCLALAGHALVMGKHSLKHDRKWWPWYVTVSAFCVVAAVFCLTV